MPLYSRLVNTQSISGYTLLDSGCNCYAVSAPVLFRWKTIRRFVWIVVKVDPIMHNLFHQSGAD